MTKLHASDFDNEKEYKCYLIGYLEALDEAKALVPNLNIQKIKNK